MLRNDCSQAAQIRLRVSKWLQANPHYVLPNFQTLQSYKGYLYPSCQTGFEQTNREMDWELYCKEIKQGKRPGDIATLFGVAEVYHVNIVVVGLPP